MVNKKRIICVMLICLFVISFTNVIAAEKINEIISQETENHTTVKPDRDNNGNPFFENDDYIMKLDEKSLGITIEDKETGYQYHSVKLDDSSNASWQGFMNSGVSVEFYSKKSTMPERVDLSKGEPKISFTYYTDGFDADLTYESYEFKMCVEVRLTEDGMTAGVKQDSIVEGENYVLGAIYLYPMFGATKLGEEPGYMFLPEGAGALIDLVDNNGKYKTPYMKKIFGDNIGIDKFEQSQYNRPAITEPEKITYPVFGMVYTKKHQGFLGIVENGQYNAEVLAYPNGVTTDYNWITAKFNYREVYTKQTSEASGVPTYEKTPYMRDIKIRFKFVSKDRADYTGLAKTYQTYLIEKGELKKQKDEFEMKIDFFGADSKKWFIFNVVVPMTTVQQMDKIIQDLTDNNINDILPVYSGWQSKGISLNYGSGNFKIENKLGSQKELFALIDKLNDENIDFVLEQDLLKANPSRFYNTSKDIVKGINQVIIEKPTNAGVFRSMYCLTPTKAVNYANDLYDRYNDTVVYNVALTSITNTLFSYYSGGKIYTRGDTVKKMQDIAEVFDSIDLSLEAPNEYMWKYTKKYFDMPMSTSNYTYLSKEVPFLPIVLKGYIPYWASDNNFEANEKKFFLKMIEYGAYPSFLITGESPSLLRDTNSSYIYTSQYNVLKATMNNYYDEIGEVLRLVEGIPIKSHNYIANDIVSVVYDNGIRFVLNYSNEDYVSGDMSVPAMSFTVN